MWLIRFLISRSDIILGGIILGFAARFLFGPPATDQIDVGLPDPIATKRFDEINKTYEKLLNEYSRSEAAPIGDILIDSSAFEENDLER